VVDRNSFQLDQTEPENQIIRWHQSERCRNADLGSNVLTSAVIVYQVSDQISPFIAGTDQNDRRRCHSAMLVDRYFISQKGEGSGRSTSFILTGHY
jgi:hypothetical protein